MRRLRLWIPLGLLAALVLAGWGVWTWRLTTQNRALANALEAQRQRAFADLTHHVEQIQALLGKGLVTGSLTQNMRYMGDVNRHATAAVDAFTSLPLPAPLSASTGKFLQQVGDFSLSVLRNEAAQRPMGGHEREELARLQTASAGLSQQLSQIRVEQGRSLFRWHPPARLSWSALVRGLAAPGGAGGGAGLQAGTLGAGWQQVGTAMEKMPVFLYDGPFSDHTAAGTPAMSGLPLNQQEVNRLWPRYLPNFRPYKEVGITEVGGQLPAFNVQLAPVDGKGKSTVAHTATVELARNGGHLIYYLNSRLVGSPAVPLSRARALAADYLAAAGFLDMTPTYGQVQGNTATLAFAWKTGGAVVYRDQVKVKVALDNGEILAVDARSYVMHHQPRSLPQPRLTARQAEERVNPNLEVTRVQLALIPDQAGTGEILAYELLGRVGDQTYLVYVNALTGAEEQVLQQVESDGGTFVL